MLTSKTSLAKEEADKSEMLPLPHCLSFAPNEIAVMSARASHPALHPNKVPKTLNTASAAEVYPRHFSQEGRDRSTLLRTTDMIPIECKGLK